MGADLYIKSIYDANYEKFQTAFNELAEARDGILTRPSNTGVQYPCFCTHAEKEKIAEKLMLALMSVKNGTPDQNKLAENIEKILEKLNGLRFKDPGYYTSKREKLTTSKLKPIYKAIQKQVEIAHGLMYSVGYFRESYGGGGLLSRLGLSWWQDFGPLVDKGIMPPENAAKFLKILKERKPTIKSTAEWAVEKKITIDEKNTLAAWDRYHTRAKKELIDFLQKAIDLKEPIYASI